MNPLTPRQKEIFDLIKKHYKKHGYPCTQSSLARATEMTRSGLQVHIKALLRKGFVQKTPDGQVYPQTALDLARNVRYTVGVKG